MAVAETQIKLVGVIVGFCCGVVFHFVKITCSLPCFVMNFELYGLRLKPSISGGF